MTTVRRNRRRWPALAAAMAFAFIARSALAEPGWPRPSLPENVTVYPVEDVVVTNGLPMKLTAFSSRQPRALLLEWFRQNLGKAVVENRLGDKIILGQARGDHYLTIQLESTGAGTRGLAAVTDLKTAYDQQDQTRATRDRWLQSLPPGSQILSATTSSDRGQRAEHLIYLNKQSASTNRDVLRDFLEQRGLSFERETRAAERPAASAKDLSADARTLYFRGQAGEAMATITRDAQEMTVVVLNTISGTGNSK